MIVAVCVLCDCVQAVGSMDGWFSHSSYWSASISRRKVVHTLKWIMNHPEKKFEIYSNCAENYTYLNDKVFSTPSIAFLPHISWLMKVSRIVEAEYYKSHKMQHFIIKWDVLQQRLDSCWWKTWAFFSSRWLILYYIFSTWRTLYCFGMYYCDDTI